MNVLAGVLQEPSSKRVYPNGELGAGILGWVNADGKGGGGIEQQLNKELSGKDGEIRYAQSGGRRCRPRAPPRSPPWPVPRSS